MTCAVTAAIDAIRRGEMVVVTDDEDRENEGDLIIAAEAATPEAIAFIVRHTSGLICVALPGERLDALQIPPMVTHNRDAHGTAFAVSVDLAEGVTTGISARDRASTIRALADPASVATDFLRPGHIMPLRSREGGVLTREGHTEAAVDLTRLAGLQPAGVICEIVSGDHTRMANATELDEFASRHGLQKVSISELVEYRLRHEHLVSCSASARVPTPHGEFDCQVWESFVDGLEHVVLTHGDIATEEPLLVRVHSECLTGDLFGSLRCDCGAQLEDSLAAITSAGRGVLIYLRGHEGRGIGLADKLHAYTLQDAGRDTVDANIELGLPVDSRQYTVAGQIIRQLGVRRLRLMTNNPAKYTDLQDFGLEITERVPLPPRLTNENNEYLSTKRDRLGHLLPADLGDRQVFRNGRRPVSLTTAR
ncbi:bifunctional 3,4-dihydroxy-2-butanone-4-phosphate synthase/GTP cyclohydrolase II [Mycobacterium sp. 1274756.6]|uniref:bifunctional 3,4-dihydroxy-2-butanone-4-phosphate synthase/GTP cyclohydrolase II n=1 Tax=Mycobacterium sp. 1274756.6 TaxID=1834076 RepID=UPI000800A6F6|nr:bifunctional 3,4-dihydroxy-2-butanone-4-phosphate synthase/GTP cyclohydrolase II [Mycobacterium sp. 1274756.6]OBJ67824.1 bifunctional 3,4-dihydroxy-2-butanone 4-phosphate synthase/GTP cyclohydrolase II [Mycobacterium sp. 1274756.6]